MIRILITLILFCNVVNAQLTTRVSTTTNISAPTVYTKLGVDSAIKVAIVAYAKTRVPVDSVVNVRLSKLEKSVTELQVNDTIFWDKRFFPVIGKTVSLNLDSVSKYVKVAVPVVDLTSVNNSIASLVTRTTALETRVVSNEVRVTSLEQWRTTIEAWKTTAQANLDKINGQIAALPAVPTKAVSTSTSTTTTTTTTILQ